MEVNDFHGIKEAKQGVTAYLFHVSLTSLYTMFSCFQNRKEVKFMLNQVVLVGRLASDPEMVETENGKKVSNIIVAYQRAFKNTDGVYETDFIKCVLWNNIATNTAEFCKKGDMVGIKGRIQSSNYGTKKYSIELIAEKVTFLSSKSSK